MRFKGAICDCSGQLQGVPGPPGPKCQKKRSQKGRLGPVGPECQKRAAEKVKNDKKVSLRHFLDFFGTFLALRADRKKTNNHRHFGQDGVRDKQDPSLGQTGPLPGTNWDPSVGQTGLFPFNSTVKSAFCPVCPWTGRGLSLERLSQKGRQKNVYVFSVYWFLFFSPQKSLAILKL